MTWFCTRPEKAGTLPEQGSSDSDSVLSERVNNSDWVERSFARDERERPVNNPPPPPAPALEPPPPPDDLQQGPEPFDNFRYQEDYLAQAGPQGEESDHALESDIPAATQHAHEHRAHAIAAVREVDGDSNLVNAANGEEPSWSVLERWIIVPGMQATLQNTEVPDSSEHTPMTPLHNREDVFNTGDPQLLSNQRAIGGSSSQSLNEAGSSRTTSTFPATSSLPLATTSFTDTDDHSIPSQGPVPESFPEFVEDMGNGSFLCKHPGRRRKPKPCGKTWKSAAALKTHYRTHVRNRTYERKYPCEHCTRSFSAISHLVKHVDGVHRKIRHWCQERSCQAPGHTYSADRYDNLMTRHYALVHPDIILKPKAVATLKKPECLQTPIQGNQPESSSGGPSRQARAYNSMSGTSSAVSQEHSNTAVPSPPQTPASPFGRTSPSNHPSSADHSFTQTSDAQHTRGSIVRPGNTGSAVIEDLTQVSAPVPHSTPIRDSTMRSHTSDDNVGSRPPTPPRSQASSKMSQRQFEKMADWRLKARKPGNPSPG